MNQGKIYTLSWYFVSEIVPIFFEKKIVLLIEKIYRSSLVKEKIEISGQNNFGNRMIF